MEKKAKFFFDGDVSLLVVYEVPTASKLFGGCSLGGNQATKSKLLQKMSKEFTLNEYVKTHLYRFLEKNTFNI